MVRLLIEERYTWPVRTVLLGGGGLRATSYQILIRGLPVTVQNSRVVPNTFAEGGAPGYIRSDNGLELIATALIRVVG